MATEVNQTYFAWSQEESAERDGSQGVPASEMLDHGSISFGRFKVESLSWEKWSVFTHDRRHEEFGKLNGLVAQKKAYFEEYYKKIRELKALQQQNQQTELTLEYSGDGSDSSQTGEDEPVVDLESPAGSGTVVDSVEQAAAETSSEHELKCHDNHDNANLTTELSSSNLSTTAGGLQQADQDITENDGGDNCADNMDIVEQNSSSGHDLGTAHETRRAPKRIVGMDSRLRQAPKIIPKSVKTYSNNPLDRIVVSKGPGSVRLSASMNQKPKPDNICSLQRPKAAPHKMVGSVERSKLMAKEAPGFTCVRRPSSAASRRPSTGDRRPVARESTQKPAGIATPQRPSTAEGHPVPRESALKQANLATPRRPSIAERRPVTKESALKHADIATLHLPSTGERQTFTPESALKIDPKTPSRTRATVAHPKGALTTVGNVKKVVTPNAVKNSKPETQSYVKERPKGLTPLDSHSTRPKRPELQVAGKPKSSSVNLPPRKKSSSSIGGVRALETLARPKKQGIQETVQSRAGASKNNAALQTGIGKPPPPPPPPRRSSRMASKPNANSSAGGRKPKVSAPQWH